MKKEYILYILMRTDLPSMNAGKAMAQASHASNAFIKKHGKTTEAKEWADSTNQGFGTVIVLSATRCDLETVVSEVTMSDLVVDPTYPYIVSSEIAGLINESKHTVDPIIKNDGNVVLHREEVTCAYVFGDKEALKHVLGHLKLHP